MSDPSSLFQSLSELVAQRMTHYGVPGVALGIVHGAQESVAGFGVTNVEHPLPVDPDTIFGIGSITKTFTGTAAMRLVERGQLSLDAPVRTYIPEFKLADAEAAARVTLRHLFTHTSGWLGDQYDDSGGGVNALAHYVAKMHIFPQLTPLGAAWSYNNANFWLAARVLEVVTGQLWEEAIRQLVLEPLGLRRTFFFADECITYRVAVGHLVGAQGASVARPWSELRRRPSGGIVSSVRDQLRYARFHMSLLGSQSGLLSVETLQQMQTPQVKGALDDEFGVTWFIQNVGGVKLVSHSGGTLGQTAFLMFAPQRDFAISVLTNANRGPELYREVVAWALQHYLGVSEPTPHIVMKSAAQLNEYVGAYASQLSAVTLSAHDAGLQAQVVSRGGYPRKDTPPGPAMPPVRVVFCGEDRIMALDEPFKDVQGEFLRAPDGRIAWLRWGLRIHKPAGSL